MAAFESDVECEGERDDAGDAETETDFVGTGLSVRAELSLLLECGESEAMLAEVEALGLELREREGDLDEDSDAAALFEFELDGMIERDAMGDRDTSEDTLSVDDGAGDPVCAADADAEKLACADRLGIGDEDCDALFALETLAAFVAALLAEAAATETEALAEAVSEDEASSVGGLLPEAAAERDAALVFVPIALVDADAAADGEALPVGCTVCVSVGMVAFAEPDVVPVGDVDADEQDEVVGSDVGVGGGASVTVPVIDGIADSAEDTDAEALAAAD